MNPLLFDWLIGCPALRGISPLALALHDDLSLDLRGGIARAIAVNVREQASGRLLSSEPPSYHRRTARMHSIRSRGVRLNLERGVIRMGGRLAAGVGISETSGRAVIHIRRSLPETVVAAVAGRQIADLVALPAFRRGFHPVTAAIQDGDGLSIWFRTADQAIPLADLPRLLRRQSCGD